MTSPRKDAAALRILFVIPGESEGSSMVFARRQAHALKALGIEVQCFHLASRTSPRKLASEAIRLRSLMNRFRPQIMHAHFGTVTGIFTVALAGRLPVIVTYRGSDLNRVPTADGLRAAMGRVFSQFAALGAAKIVCVSAALRERLWWRRHLVSVLPSGVDTDVFRPASRAEARRQLGWSDAIPIVLFNAGHDARNKRLDLAEKATYLVRMQLPETRLEILNGGTPPQAVPLLMNAADCLLVTSDSEGSPTIVQEALATNLPVVSVDVGDVAERLRGVTQTHISPRDPQSLSAALLDILRARERSNGRERSSDICAPRVAEELARLYRSIVAQTSPQEDFAWNTTLF